LDVGWVGCPPQAAVRRLSTNALLQYNPHTQYWTSQIKCRYHAQRNI